jgi:hypothetical protein
MKKENLGAVVILAGIGIIGYIWFARNKPTTADKQLANLTAQSNALSTGSSETIDEPFQLNPQEITLINQIQSSPHLNNSTPIDFSTMTPADVQSIQNTVAGINFDALVNIGSAQIAQNMGNASTQSSLNALQNYDFSAINWSNIKIK